MSSNSSTFAEAITAGVLAALRGVIRDTQAPVDAVAALSTALAAAQQYMLQEMPGSFPMIAAMAQIATQLPAEIGVKLVSDLLDEAHAETCQDCGAVQAAMRAKPYGEA